MWDVLRGNADQADVQLSMASAFGATSKRKLALPTLQRKSQNE